MWRKVRFLPGGMPSDRSNLGRLFDQQGELILVERTPLLGRLGAGAASA